ncbi:type I 3-dehydroquinate dehydratase [Vagococcus sp.]|uniref:type I 3-dehydroquinate dehydratase n=1 Tax=Vagococcus sp. TaxID=1933889 RepID=UPI003F96912B
MENFKIRNLTLGNSDPKVCVSLIANNFKELFSEAMRVSKLDCDIIEWRADYFMYINDLTFMRKAAYFIRYAIEDKPLIFTFRSLEEGGGQEIDDDFYFRLNHYMIKTGLVDAIDLELARLPEFNLNIMEFAYENNVKVLISHHNTLLTPDKDELVETITDMVTLGANISKIAVTPNSMEDVLTILSASNQVKMKHPDAPFVLLGMGELGKLTRFTGELFGSVMTFANNGKQSSAPGQMTIEELRSGFKLFDKEEKRRGFIE